MKALFENALRFARVLIAVVFVLNAIGIIDQAIPAKEMMERGVSAAASRGTEGERREDRRAGPP